MEQQVCLTWALSFDWLYLFLSYDMIKSPVCVAADRYTIRTAMPLDRAPEMPSERSTILIVQTNYPYIYLLGKIVSKK